jgi:hypothetical protein
VGTGGREYRCRSQNGDLKFSLDGYKFKGSWVLVRTRDRPDSSSKHRGRNWLLIKHRDFWSGPVDITEFAPLSVKSEGNFDNILADEMPDIWVTGRPATANGGSARTLHARDDRAGSCEDRRRPDQ